MNQKLTNEELKKRLSELEHQNKLLKSEAIKYRTLFDSFPHGITVSDSHGNIIEANSTSEKLIGIDKEEQKKREIAGREWRIIRKDGTDMPPEEWASVIALKENRLVTGCEMGIVKSDGQITWISVTSAPLPLEGYGVVITYNDITNNKLAEDAINKSKRELQQTLDATTDGIWTWNFKMNELAFSPKYYTMLGYVPNEFPASYENWVDLIHPDDREKALAIAQKYLETKPDHYENEFRLRTKHGDYRWIRTLARVAERDEHGDAVYMIGNHEDITERKRAEEALKESEKKYRLIFKKAPIGITHFDMNGVITSCNDVLAEILGTQREKIIGFNMTTNVTDIQSKAAIREVLSGRTGYFEGKYTSVTGGKAVIVRNIYSPIFAEDGLQKGGICITEDISERKRLEEELLRAQKLESVGLLAGGIAHDFNNLLTTIIGNVSMARMQVTPEGEMFEMLSEVEAASTRAQTLTKQLLTFAKGGAPLKETASIKDILKESCSFVLRGSKSRCEISIAEDLWPGDVDVGQISQAINNIVINANQAMPEGGIIRVAAENLMIANEQSLPLKQGRYIRISIKDQGVGISEKHLLNIFDPYFTTKQEGSGLGLATTYSIIKKHEGHITVESQLGVGTIFHIYLPASDKAVPEKEEVKLIKGQGRILVMDDEALLRKMVGRMLEKLGYESEFAKDGAEAIRIYKEAQESGKPYDAVILDLTIPGGIGGKEAIQKLLEIDPEVKAIVSSGYSDDPVLANFQEYGFKGMMPKPFESRSLGKVLHDMLKDEKE